jgi:hypothetical protein
MICKNSVDSGFIGYFMLLSVDKLQSIEGVLSSITASIPKISSVHVNKINFTTTLYDKN